MTTAALTPPMTRVDIRLAYLLILHSYRGKNNEGTFGGKTAADLKEQQLPCKGCKKPFTDSVEDQAHRVAQGWIHPPARCPPCKASYLEALSKNPQHCNDFKSGNCAYGDKCRYSHELPLVSMHIAMDDESSDDLDLDCY